MNKIAALTKRTWHFRSFGTVFVLIGLIMIIAASMGMFRTISIRAGVEGAPYWLLMGFSTVLIILGWESALVAALKRNAALCLLLLLALASAMWSFEPFITLREGVTIGYLLIVSIIVTRRFHWHALFGCFLAAACFGIGLSLLFVFANPATVFHFDSLHFGALKGVFQHKNLLALNALTGSVCGLHLARWTWANRSWQISALTILASALCIAIVLITDSLTAQIALFSSILVTLLWLTFVRFHMRTARLAITIVVGLIPFVTLLVLFVDAVRTHAVLSDKAVSLLVRREAWLLALPDTTMRWIAGYGLGVYWLPDHRAALEVRQALRFDIGNVHNGYLEILLALGIPGLILFLAHLMTVIRAISHELTHAPTYRSVALLAVLAAVLTLNLSESSLLAVFRSQIILYLIIANLALASAKDHAPQDSVML